jgi:hypothetical protein
MVVHPQMKIEGLQENQKKVRLKANE